MQAAQAAPRMRPERARAPRDAGGPSHTSGQRAVHTQTRQPRPGTTPGERGWAEGWAERTGLNAHSHRPRRL